MSCFSTVSSLLSHAPWKEMCRSIHRSTLYLCLTRSLPLCLSFFLLTHSTSFVLSPLNAPSLDSVCPAPHIFVSFLPLSLARSLCFSLVLSSAFSYFLHRLFSLPLRSSFFLHLTGLCPPIFFLFICSCV